MITDSLPQATAYHNISQLSSTLRSATKVLISSCWILLELSRLLIYFVLPCEELSMCLVVVNITTTSGFGTRFSCSGFSMVNLHITSKSHSYTSLDVHHGFEIDPRQLGRWWSSSERWKSIILGQPKHQKNIQSHKVPTLGYFTGWKVESTNTFGAWVKLVLK